MVYRQNIISNLTTKLLLFFLSFVGSVLIARALGPEQKGMLAYAMTGFILLATYGHFGINNVIIYFHKRKQISYPRLISTNGIFLVSVSILYGAAFIFIKTTDAVLTRYSLGFLLLGSLFILSNYLLVLLRAFYIANENLIQMNRYVLISETATVLSIICFFFLGQLTPFVCIAISVFSLLFQMVLLGKNQHHLFSGLKPRFDIKLLKQEIGYGSHAFLSGLFLFLIYRADQFFIHVYQGDESLGIYSVAVGIAGCFLFVPEGIKTALTGKLYSFNRDDPQKYRYFHKTVRFSVFVCAAMAMAGMVLCPLIYVLYGKEFAGGIRALQILLPGVVFLAVGQLGGIFFYTMGEIKKCTLISALACCLNMVLNMMLIPKFSIEGAAAASLISYIALALLTVNALLKNKNIRLKDLLIPKKEDFSALNPIKLPWK